MSAALQWLERRRPDTGSSRFGPIGAYFTDDELHLVQLQRESEQSIGLRSFVALPYTGTRKELIASPNAV